MKKLILLILLFVVCSCGTVKQIPVNNKEVVNIRDSVVLRDSVITTYINKERIKEVVPELDTLVMNTKYAKSISYLDTTTNTLQGTLEQLDSVPVPVKVVFKDKIITKEKVIEKEIPVPVEVVREKKVTPKWIWWSLGLNFLIFVIFLLRLKLNKLFVS